MKLSEAIRIGAKKRPQGFGAYFTKFGAHGERELCSCALGAAFEACGYIPDSEPLRNIVPEGYMESCDINLYAPVTYKGDLYPVGNLVVTLNDGEEKTREEIADILEGLGQ